MLTYLFGTQGIALGTYRSIKRLFSHKEIDGFMVTDLSKNPSSVEGMPVYELQERRGVLSQKEKSECEIIICTPENVMAEIEESLLMAGFTKIVRMTSMRWAKLQESAFIAEGRFMPLNAYPVSTDRATLKIFQAKFFKDQALKSGYVFPEYFTNLQVGAARTDIRVAEITDNMGDDNISDRNGNYSELTGLYWIWKNWLKDAEEEYIGLAHYRRFLEFSEDDLLRLSGNDIDVVLPYPMPYLPNVEEHQKRYLTVEEWQAVWQALEELDADSLDIFREFLQQDYLYNYNIVLAKKEVLLGYCEWLFPVLMRVESIMEAKGLNEPHRYIGYIGEELESFYFLKKADKLRITHAGCHFLT